MSKLSRTACLVTLALALPACAGRLPRQDTLAQGPFEAALAEFEALPEDEQEGFVRALARSRLALAAESESPAVRTSVFARISTGGSGTRALLESLDRASDEDVRTRALLALALLGEERARSRLARFADDEDDTLRRRGRIAEALDLSRRAALERITSTIADERRAALRALDGVDDPEVVDALLAVARRDPDASVRAAACRAMPRLGEAEREILRTIADEATSSEALAACARALLDAATDAEALAFVETLADPPDDLAIARAQGAVAALGGDAGDALTAYLLRALAAPRPSIRAAAANLLTGQRNVPEVRNALLASLAQEVEPDTKLAIAAALRADTASRARVLAMLHTLVPLETYSGLEAAALAVALEGFTPDTQAKIERATSSPVVIERALAYRVFIGMGDMRRALEGLFDVDDDVRFGTAARVLDL